PGNPVSVLVTFHQFVKPALLKMMGKTKSNPSQWAINSKQMKKKPGRLDFVRGTLAVNESGEKTVRATVGQDSHMLSGLATADHLIHFARQAELLAVGELVEIDHLSWTE
ncbi:MAG TPA: hypothetical protein V6C72_06685, partial [Chroococcales cyanobacterium]